MHQSSVCKFFAPAVLVIALASPALAQQSAANFAKAITHRSTSPYYILITVINDKTGTRQTICTMAPFLEGAIHYQYQLPYTDAGEHKGRDIALASGDHTYHFSDPRALKNLQVRYTLQELAQVRRQLSGYSTAELAAGASSFQSKFHIRHTQQNRDAVAYVLLERGLQPAQADMTGGLYLVH